MKKSFLKRHLLHILFLFLIVGTMVFLGQHQRSVPPYADITTAVDESGTACEKTIFEKVQAQKKKLFYNCTHCSETVKEVLHNFTFNWTKNEGNHQKLRSLLIASCNGFQKAAVTQNNSPLGTLIEYDGEKRTLTVNEDIFNNFPKDSPFSDKMLDTCAVVGNGGILANSSCGESIDSAQFVIRCNLPPLEEWHKHVGKKTDLVTANPTVFVQKWMSVRPIGTSAAPNATNSAPIMETCTACNTLRNVLKDFSLNWIKNEENHQKLRSLLITSCNGFQKAALTRNNTSLKQLTQLVEQKHTGRANEDIPNYFPEDSPFSDKMLDTCAVVGNGGILANSSCGESIDSAQFVIRCNLPAMENWHKHVGKKTDLVTANPIIFIRKYDSLKGELRAFVDNMIIYGDSLLFQAFCTNLTLTVHHVLEDFNSPLKTIYVNHLYVRDLHRFWQSQGLNPGLRMSTGFMMVSLALEICKNINVYGFWPFDIHPYGFQPLTQHYYDDSKPVKFHNMSAEFDFLVKLHNHGVLQLHVGECLQRDKVLQPFL